MLSTSLREKEAKVGRLQNELQQAASTPTKLSEVLKLTTQIASLQQKLQEMEYQKQQAELERETAVQDVEARERFEVKLHAELGKHAGSWNVVKRGIAKFYCKFWPHTQGPIKKMGRRLDARLI